MHSQIFSFERVLGWGITPAIPEELKAKTKGQPSDKVMEIIFLWLQEKGALKTR